LRIPPLLTDFIHDRVCKPNCEKMLTLPRCVDMKQFIMERVVMPMEYPNVCALCEEGGI